MSDAIELYSKINDPIQAIDKMGEWFGGSGMFGCQNMNSGKVLAFACMALKQTPFDIIRTYDLVDGKLRKKSLAILAEFRQRGGRHKWIATGDDGKAAELELTIDGETIRSRFTIEDAQRAGLVRPKSNWEKTPGNMLRVRAISNGVAMLCPEIVAGCVDSQEDEAPVDAKPLLPPRETKPAEPVEEKPKPPVIEAEVVSQPETKPDPQPEPVAKSFSIHDVTADVRTGRLSAATQQAIMDAIGEQNCDRALAWLKDKGWVRDSLGELNTDRAKRILLKPREFVGHIGGLL